MTKRPTVLASRIGNRIALLRGQKVVIDADLAELYGITTKRLNEQVRRNRGRFPKDFMFPLTAAEKAEVVANCDHLRKLKFSPALPLAFTEHGALMAASVLNTPRAVEMSLYVVRVFVRLRETLAAHKVLAANLEKLEQTIASLALKHDILAGSTRVQFKQVFDAIRQLMAPPPEPKKRPIGFIHPKER